MTDWRGLVQQLVAELEQVTDPEWLDGDTERLRHLLAMARLAAPDLVCGGRALGEHGQPVGEPCGRRFETPKYITPSGNDFAEMASIKGWRVSSPDGDGRRDVMCPRCAKPDRAVVKLCDDLAASIGGVDATT